MTGPAVVALGRDQRPQVNQAYRPSRAADPAPPAGEETLLAAMASVLSLIEVTARIQKQTAEILHALATQDAPGSAAWRLQAAEAMTQAPTSPPDGPAGQPGRVQRPAGGQHAHRLAEPLTEREQTVLRFLHGTLPLRDIGQELHVSQNTIKSHTRAIYRKLGVSTRHDAIQRCRELGILHVQPHPQTTHSSTS